VAYRRFDHLTARLDGARRTPQGGLVVDAKLTRPGVFSYRRSDGKTVRELRHPDDLFSPDALGTLEDAPVVQGHPGMVTANDWRELALGHVRGGVRRDGEFVAATLAIQDSATVAKIESGELSEVSLGYEVEVKEESGEFGGEKYDARQTSYRFNHIGLGPKGWGRMGGDVRLYLDDKDSTATPSTVTVPTVTLDSDGNEIPPSYAPAVSTPNTESRTDAEPKVDAVETTARLDALTGERDALKAEIENLRKDYAEVAGKIHNRIDPSEIPGLVRARVCLEHSARKVHPAGKFDELSDREVMVAALEAACPEFKADDKSDDYVRARFDAAVESASRADAAIAELGAATVPNAANTPPAKSRLDEALEKLAAETADKNGPPPGAVVRKSR
jgi:uncharacterized protein